MAFSSAVRIADLDDFLAPAVDCVLPQLETKDNKASINASAELVMPRAKKPDLIKTAKKEDGAEKATVGLSDCLVCSGCVTSAETILLEQHSLEEFPRLFI